MYVKREYSNQSDRIGKALLLGGVSQAGGGIYIFKKYPEAVCHDRAEYLVGPCFKMTAASKIDWMLMRTRERGSSTQSNHTTAKPCIKLSLSTKTLELCSKYLLSSVLLISY